MAGNDTNTTPPDPRKERLAAALRENLKRRKAQVRGRQVRGGNDVTTRQTGPSALPKGEPPTDPTSGTAAR